MKEQVMALNSSRFFNKDLPQQRYIIFNSHGDTIMAATRHDHNKKKPVVAGHICLDITPVFGRTKRNSATACREACKCTRSGDQYRRRGCEYRTCDENSRCRCFTGSENRKGRIR